MALAHMLPDSVVVNRAAACKRASLLTLPVTSAMLGLLLSRAWIAVSVITLDRHAI